MTLTARADGNTHRFRDVCADLLREPDGTLVFLLIGQRPFQVTGVLTLDPETAR